MERDFKYEIMTEIKDRWSPRAFSDEPVSGDDVLALLEAARYAPSCFNEQPWRFIIADEENSLERMRSILTPSNQEWANNAPVLIMVLAKKAFAQNGKDNYWHMFDAGTAWGYLSLEAQRRGICTHAMGGFSRGNARSVFEIPEDTDVITVIAVGYYGDPGKLSEELRLREHPETRKSVLELLDMT